MIATSTNPAATWLMRSCGTSTWARSAMSGSDRRIHSTQSSKNGSDNLAGDDQRGAVTRRQRH
jgi:hypothetical protein